jgi:hypothetical protein
MPAEKRRKIPQSVLEQAITVPREAILALWELWKALYASTRGRGYQLNARRAEDIAVAVIVYGYETCVRAIIGAYFSSFHMGDNPAQKRYTSIQLILRYGDRWRVAKFEKLYKENIKDAEAFRKQHLVDYSTLTVVHEAVEK